MRLNVTFKTSLAIDMAKHPPGEELAEHLRARFEVGGIAISAIDNYEDFGWALDTEQDGKKLFVLIGHTQDPDDPWLLQINEYKAKFFDIFRRNVALKERESLAPKIHRVLSADEAIANVRWYKGDFADGNPSPTPEAA